MAAIVVAADGAGLGAIPEAGPAGARFKLGIGAEQLVVAADAAIHAAGLVIPVDAGEGPFGAPLAGYRVLLGRELCAPLLIALLGARPAAVGLAGMELGGVGHGGQLEGSR